MARNLQTVDDREWASRIEQRFFRVATSHRTSRERVWRATRKRWEPTFVGSEVKRPPYVKYPLLFRTVENQTQHLLAAAEANGRYVYAHGGTPDTPEGTSDLVTRFVDRMFRWGGSDLSFGNEDVLERWAHGGLLYGNAAVHLNWQDFGPGNSGVRFDVIDMFDFFPDEDQQPSKWYIIRKYMPVWQLRDMARSLSAPDPKTGEPRDGGRAERVFRRVLKMVKEGHSNVSEGLNSVATDAYQKSIDIGRTTDIGRRNLDDKDDPFNVRVMILSYFETPTDGLLATIIPGFANSSEPLVMQKETNPFGICPIVAWTPNPVDNEFWGLGAGEIIGPTQDVLDATLRAQVRLTYRIGDPATYSRRSARLRREFIMSPAGKHTELNQPDDFGYINSNVDGGAFPFLLNFMKQAADVASGESEQRRGQGGGSGSATEAAILETSSQTNDKKVHRRFSRAIEQLARVILAVGKLNITQDYAIPIFGRDTTQFLKLKPENLEGTWEVEFGGTLRGQTAQQEIANNNVMAASYGPAGIVDLDALARDTFMKMGKSNVDQFMTQKAGRPQVDPEEENRAYMQFGQELEVNPRDNHAQHVPSHQQVLNEMLQREQVTGAPDPRMSGMQLHIAEHTFVFQQQQLAQSGIPQQGGQPGALQGGTPAGLGAAGQPQTLTGRQATLDTARQSSNQLAGGQSPGGSAPGRQVGQVL